MVSDIGPGMRMLIGKLEAVEGDYSEHIPLPNGYIVSIIRKQSFAEVPIPEDLQARGVFGGRKTLSVGGSYGAAHGLFEIALMDQEGDIARGPEGFMAPVDVARKMREWFELPAED